jgi:hypothetical protein
VLKNVITIGLLSKETNYASETTPEEHANSHADAQLQSAAFAAQ